MIKIQRFVQTLYYSDYSIREVFPVSTDKLDVFLQYLNEIGHSIIEIKESSATINEFHVLITTTVVYRMNTTKKVLTEKNE